MIEEMQKEIEDMETGRLAQEAREANCGSQCSEAHTYEDGCRLNPDNVTPEKPKDFGVEATTNKPYKVFTATSGGQIHGWPAESLEAAARVHEQITEAIKKCEIYTSTHNGMKLTINTQFLAAVWMEGPEQ
jgi:hypothetical protein